MSIEYYNNKADDFFKSTIDVEMQDLYDRFEEHLMPQGHVLDAGCGSGRDTKYFLDKGYVVDAFDASEELVKLASEYTSIEVKKMYFQDFEVSNKYDGIWACASLLHVPKNEIHYVFEKFIRALKPKGVWYMSFKLGDKERTKDGRFFNDYTIDELKELLYSYNENLQIIDLWVTPDNRPERNDNWVNAIVIKK